MEAGGRAAAGGWRRRAGFAGAALGVVAASAAAGVALERLTVGRGVRREARLALDASAPYGTLRGTPGTAVADDGTVLHYETEDPGGAEAPGSPRATVVFSHGYCLSQDSWHFQRAALRGVARAVYWDQRSHGRSRRGAGPVSIDRLGRDLKAVVDAAAPEGPLVLVGHSMGGMTVMALVDQYPELVRDRVAGVAFVGTSAGRLAELTYGLPTAPAQAVRRALPGVLRALGARAELVERGRRATADLFAGLVRRYSFGAREVDPVLARFAERMIEATPIDVVAEFYPAFAEHDKADALTVLADADVPVLALAGERDVVTPRSHTEAIAALLPDAELVVVPDAGHLVMLEHPRTVTARLLGLLVRAGALAPDAAGAEAGTG
ncbi:alpha/beta hydrolase [Streptomyces sp. MRC013]|uniref:alpha/beta fold hydrolase n=1 Tax=Streptomyces sp. MRC013 TaxID=2898276 RepID=UPI002025F560|nr:alpha/beta hydrolase [Streptomyces sp. MRC013]URM92649.1 alpha/beta hydrolase [Streptomyces sp. MRC013]